MKWESGDNVLDKDNTLILNHLIANGRMSFKEIAAKTRLSDSTIQYRINNLIKNGILERFTVHLNLEKLGFPIETTIGMSVEPRYIEEVATRLSKMPEFYSVWIVTGAHNISCRGAFKNQKVLNDVVTKLNALRGVTQYHLSLATRKKKNMVDVIGLQSLLESG